MLLLHKIIKDLAYYCNTSYLKTTKRQSSQSKDQVVNPYNFFYQETNLYGTTSKTDNLELTLREIKFNKEF